MSIFQNRGGEQEDIDKILNKPGDSGPDSASGSSGTAATAKTYSSKRGDEPEDSNLTVSEKIAGKVRERRKKSQEHKKDEVVQDEALPKQKDEKKMTFQFNDRPRITRSSRALASKSLSVKALRSDFGQSGVKGFSKSDKLARETMETFEKKGVLKDGAVTKKEFHSTMKALRDSGKMTKTQFKNIIKNTGSKPSSPILPF
jgi:hypothetical protein